MIPRFVLAAMLSAAAMTGAAEETTSVLTDTRYAVFEEASRLTLRITGPIRYAVRGEGRTVSLWFSRTRVASPAGAARLTFQSGDISGAAITRLAGDSLRIDVTLRGTERYTLLQPAESGVLVVEVPATSARPVVRQKAAKRDEPAADGHARPPTTGSLIDIPALLRGQTAESLESPRSPAVAGNPASGMGLPGWERIAFGLAAFGIAGLTTVLVLVLLSRRNSSPARRGGILRPVLHETLPDDLSPLPAPGGFPDPSGKNRDGEEEEPWRWAEEEPEPYDAVAALAERFRRGYDEVGLAVRLHGVRPSPLKAESVVEAAGKGGRHGRMRTARKLGVGRGEVDLAFHLKEYEQRHAGGSQ